MIERVASAVLPTEYGNFSAIGFRGFNNEEYLVLSMGDLTDGDVLVRIHSACLTGDVLGSKRCDCGIQLQKAMELIAAERKGVIIYVYNDEGRGIGMLNKLRAYQLQDKGLDTVEANKALGFEEDQRDYVLSAEILKRLKVKKVRLLTNNPRKIDNLRLHGIDVERVPLKIPPTAVNAGYLQTKRDKLGHLL